MEKIIKILGLKKGATEADIITSIGNIQKQVTTLESEVKAKQEQLDALKDLAETAADLEQQLQEKVVIILEKDKEVFDLRQEVEALKLAKAKGAVEKKVLDKRVHAFFKANKDVKEIFVTDDATIFLRRSDAENHKRTIGGIVQTFKQK
jgi:peptidoglycan hydrolase CwlO-like protein